MDPNQQPQDPTNSDQSTPPQFGAPAPVETPTPPAQPDLSPSQPTPEVTTPESQSFGQPAAETFQAPTPQPAFPSAEASPASPQPVPGENPGQTLGIISIVLSFIGLSVIGIILGIVSRKKSKAVGASATLGTIGMIVGIVFTVIGFIVTAILVAITLTAYNGIQNRTQESNLSSQASSVVRYAELYNSMANDYPKSVSDFSKYPETTIPDYIDTNSAIYTNTAVTYVYCGTGAAQVVYLGDTADDKIIKALGTASPSEECPRAY